MKKSSNELMESILNAVSHRRGQALTIAQSEIKEPKTWSKLRPRLLGVFGENGLTRDVRRLFEANDRGEVHGE